MVETERCVVTFRFCPRNSALAEVEQDRGGPVQLHRAREHGRQLRKGRPDGSIGRLGARLVESFTLDNFARRPDPVELRGRRAFGRERGVSLFLFTFQLTVYIIHSCFFPPPPPLAASLSDNRTSDVCPSVSFLFPGFRQLVFRERLAQGSREASAGGREPAGDVPGETQRAQSTGIQFIREGLGGGQGPSCKTLQN